MNNLSRHRGSSLKESVLKNDGHRTATVWPPYGHRMATEWPPYGQPHAVHDAFERDREASMRTLRRQSLHHAGHKKEANKHKEREGRLVRLSTCSPKQLQQKLKQRCVNTEYALRSRNINKHIQGDGGNTSCSLSSKCLNTLELLTNHLGQY